MASDGHPDELRHTAPRIITGGEGVHIIDIDGNRAVDAMAGLWNVNPGYSNTAVKRAISGQLERLPHYSAFAGTSTDVAIRPQPSIPGRWCALWATASCSPRR